MMNRRDKITKDLLCGYGLSVRSGMQRIGEETWRIDSSKAHPSRLRLFLTDGMCWPFMLMEDGKWGIALAFYIWMHDKGWRMIDLAQMCADGRNEVDGWRSVETKELPEDVDTSEWEPIIPYPWMHEGGRGE